MRSPTSRFEETFPTIASLIRAPGVLFTVLLVLALGLHFVNPILSSCCFCISSFVAVLWADQRNIKSMLVSPLFALLFMQLFARPLGALILVVIGADESITAGVWETLIGLGIVGIFIAVGYTITFNKRDVFHLPVENPEFIRRVLVPLAWFGVGCYIYSFLGTLVGVATGQHDRANWEENYGNTTASLVIFVFWYRFVDVGFLLLPLIWKVLPRYVFFLSLTSLLLIFILNLISGSRGSALFPIVIIMFGYFIFRVDLRLNLEKILLVAAPIIFLMVGILGIFRTSEAFREGKTSDIGSRLSALFKIETVKKEDGGESIAKIAAMDAAARFFAGGDPLIYLLTPQVFPHAGFSNFESILWIWVPYTLYKNRPLAAESVRIFHEYRGTLNSKTHIAFSYAADLYRRFGWFGLPIGGLLMGAYMGVLTNFLFFIYNRYNALLGIMLFMLMTTLFQVTVFGTCTEFFLGWGYAIAKHLVPIFGIAIFFGKHIGGAQNYRMI